MGSKNGAKVIEDEELARVTESIGDGIESTATGERNPHCTLAVQWTGSLSLLDICSQVQRALESSRITNGHTKGHWGHYFSLAKTVHSLQ